MQLIIRHKDEPQKELRFRTGPIYIGRQLGSQVFLPDKSISRQHAVIYTTKDGKWILEDLDSANKTYLNGNAIHKAELNEGDSFQVSDFNIQVSLRSIASMPTAINMDDTILGATQDIHAITRHLDDSSSAVLKLPAKRLSDLAYCACLLCKATDQQRLADSIVSISKRQFRVNRVWLGLSSEPDSAISYQYGRTNAGVSINLESLPLQGQVANAIAKKEFYLIPRVRLENNIDKIRSAMIAPMLYEKKFVGIIYIDNTLNNEPFDTEDLTYLMILSILFAASKSKI